MIMSKYLERALEGEKITSEDAAVMKVYKEAYKKFKVKSFSELSPKDKSKALDFLDKEFKKILKGKSVD